MTKTTRHHPGAHLSELTVAQLPPAARLGCRELKRETTTRLPSCDIFFLCLFRGALRGGYVANPHPRANNSSLFSFLLRLRAGADAVPARGRYLSQTQLNVSGL